MKINTKIKFIKVKNRKIKIIILSSKKETTKKVPCIMWIHGGGYSMGMPEMVYASRIHDLIKENELVVISPRYRLSITSPYPAALEDCYSILLYIKNNAKSLYPMIDCDDTESSKDNHGHIWNTRKNHHAWKKYLGPLYNTKNISPYASPAKLKDFKNIPPFYTFVGDGEPFYKETIDFTNKAKEAGIDAKCDVYHSDVHAFDVYSAFTDAGINARNNFIKNYEYVKNKYLND